VKLSMVFIKIISQYSTIFAFQNVQPWGLYQLMICTSCLHDPDRKSYKFTLCCLVKKMVGCTFILRLQFCYTKVALPLRYRCATVAMLQKAPCSYWMLPLLFLVYTTSLCITFILIAYISCFYSQLFHFLIDLYTISMAHLTW